MQPLHSKCRDMQKRKYFSNLGERKKKTTKKKHKEQGEAQGWASAPVSPITPIWLTVIYLEKHKKEPPFHTFSPRL